jgi:chromosome segregation ATPase
LGFLSRKREDGVEPPKSLERDPRADIMPKVSDLDSQLKRLASHLEQLEKTLKQLPNQSDFRLLASEIGRLEGELERMEGKHKEGMLALYAQVHKEIRSIRGDHVIEMVDLEPVTDEKLEEASDQLSQLAKTWRKRRANPGVEPDA